SISGIRGTIGGIPQENLTPFDIVSFTSAYGTWIAEHTDNPTRKIVIGRDARISGEMVSSLVSQTLVALGYTVIDLGYASTPTTEIAVPMENADGGIIVTASHNPKQWNALKLLNNKGEFLNADQGAEIIAYTETPNMQFADIDSIGKVISNDSYNAIHIEQICNLPLVNRDAIQQANFTVAIDCVNSVGGIIIPELLKALGVEKIIPLYCEPNGNFPHNPEPLPEHLTEIANTMKSTDADVGFVVDPDVDRLAIVNEDGSMFGEEYTLVSVADYILSHTPGNTVSNLSSTRALQDITEKHGCSYSASAVGEVNVVDMMKKTNAIIGGEGNGGIIYPESHYGRDALVGIALFLSHLATSQKTCSELRATYPQYVISKNKIELTPETDVDKVIKEVQSLYAKENISTIDGLKISFETEWVHLRKSNTEAIIRIYAESNSHEKAHELAETMIKSIKKIV
ncbi:MAG: phosphoglucosamine mutase, partial [Bacteroidota bacterium]